MLYKLCDKSQKRFLSFTYVYCNNVVREHSIKNLNDIPGPKIYPIIGSLYKYWPFIGDYNADTLDKNAWLNWRRYGGIVREYPIINLIHIYEPDLMEIIFRQNDRYPARRSHVAMLHYRVGKPEVYNSGGLLSTNGPDWWRLRSSFQKNFSGPQNARNYVPLTNTVMDDFLNWIRDKDFEGNKDFLPYLNRLNLEVIGAVTFNERFGSFEESEQHSNSRSSKVISSAFGSNSGIMKLDKGVLWKLFNTPLYRKLAQSQEYLEKVSKEILLDKLNFYDVKENNDSSLLSSFIKQSDVDLKDIIGMMVDILMAGIDTTSYTTSFALYHLARNPDVQNKLYDEVSALLTYEDSGVTAKILSEAAYLKCCVKESLRLNPVAIGVGRVLQNELILKGYSIPAGTVVVTQNMVASRLPQYVKNPLQYKPERWLRGSPSFEEIHPFLSLPFGFGPRSCIARRIAEQNMCITIMKIIRNYSIEWAGGDLGVKTLLINKPDKPISLILKPRLKV